MNATPVRSAALVLPELARPLTILGGLPGSGKSKRLIETVNAARAAGRAVATFACAESPWLRARENFSAQRLIGCRQPGIICPLDHFMATGAAVEMLATLPAGSLAAFEEAHYFAPEIAPAWLAAAARGVEVLICMASWPQRARLPAGGVQEINLTAPCDDCGQGAAVDFIIVPGTDSTQSLCAACLEENLAGAREKIVGRLQAMAPFPGEKFLQQPVDLAGCAGWRVLGAEARAAAAIIRRMIAEAGMQNECADGHLSYLDYYGEFKNYLDEHHRRLDTGTRSVIYQLAPLKENRLN